MNKLRAIGVYIIIIFTQCFCVENGNSNSFRDQTDNFILQGQVFDGDFTIPGVVVNFYIEDVKFLSIRTNNKGSFKANLHHNTIYLVETLKEGYIPEKVVLNTNVSSEVLRNGGIGETFDFTISMFRDYPGLKSESFSEPVVYYVFNAKKGWFFEPDARKSKMAILSQTLVKTQQLKEKDYFKIIQDGDKALAKNKTEDAFYKYVQASQIFPDDITAREKAESIVKAYKKEKILNDFYLRTLETAEKVLGKNEYETARTYFYATRFLKPKEKSTKYKLNAVDSLSSAAFLVNRSRYDSLKISADNKYLDKEYQIALGDYEAALKLFPNDGYLKSRIVAANKILHQAEQHSSAEKDKTTASPK